MPYQEKVPLPKDGQAVAAAALVPSLRTLDANIRYLKELFEQSARGETIYARNVTCEPDLLVGQPAYFNSQTQRFERAIANTHADGTTGALTTTESTKVWGVVAVKNSATSADLLLQGYLPLDLANSVGGNVPAGPYYLSASQAGKLVQQQPPLTVMVLMSDGNGKVFVNPNFKDLFDDHKHYKFPLVCAPAGDYTPADVGHVVNADPLLEGWLPSAHSVFQGKAPANAAFGYNIAASPLRHSFPPIPLSSVSLEWNKALDADVGFTGVPLGSKGMCIIDTNGIWWLSDCKTDLPWYGDEVYVSGEVVQPDSDDSADSDSPNTIECPRHLYMEMNLWYVRMTFKTSATVVTSLRVRDGSFLSVTCYPDGGDGTTGDLQIGLDFDFIAGNDNAFGAKVVKEITGNQFLRGVVVEGIKAGSSNVTVTSTLTRLENPDDDSSDVLHQGIVTVDALLDINGRDLPVELYRLLGATEEFYENIMSLGLAANVKQAVRGKIVVPNIVLPTDTKIQLYFSLLGRTAGTIPAMQLSYRRLPMATATPAALPTTDTDLADIGGQTVAANQFVRNLSGLIPVSSGDVVYFTLTRNKTVIDAYAGQVLLLDARPRFVVPE